MRIIHFSDFHLQGDQIKRAETIVERMLEAIKPLHQQKPVDLIVFSGDLIDKGGKEFNVPKMENGFNQFKATVIDRMLGELGLPANRFVFAPGNHDVNQKAETKDDDDKLTEELKDQKAVDVFVHRKDVADKIPRIKEYNTFRDGYWKMVPDVEMESSPLQLGIKIKIGSLTVGFNCLNTAWRCFNSDTDNGIILTGKSQITDMRDFFNDCDLRFAIAHHMPVFMNHFESGDLVKVIARNYDAVFYGHTHEEEGKYESRPEGSCFIFNSPGTLCGNISATEPYKNGFMVIDYEQDEHYVEARWYWQNENEDFVQNRNYAGTGVWKHNIPGSRTLKPLAVSLFKIKKTIGFLPNDKTADSIEKLRNPANKTIQLVALSGIGKTRILQEAFDDGVVRPNSYYCEYSDDVTGLMYDIDELLLSHNGEDGLIVLDNCPNEIIESAASKRDAYDSNFRIIGVNNEYYDRKSLKVNDALQIVIKQDDMRDKVNEYIRQNTPDINGNTTIRDQITQLADGFPGMAIELVEAYKEEKGVDIHRVDYLVKKMLKFKAGHAEDHEIAMRTLALFKPFPYKVNNKEVYKFLRNNEHITPLFGKSPEEKRSIFSQVIGQHDGSLIECTESWLNVRPFPLAVWLVDKWFGEDNDEERMDEIMSDIAGLDDNSRHVVVEGMYERLRYMKESADAQDMVARLMAENGSFCNEKVVCSDMGSRLFLGMSSVNPVAVAKCLKHVLFPQSIEWLRENLTDHSRRNIIWALEKLCFDANSYPYAVWVLARLAIAENETWDNNACAQLTQLFHIALPGTEVPLLERLNTLKSVFVAGEEYKNITLDCISGAFYNGQFVRMGDSAKFGLESKSDYSPISYNEISDYWIGCRDILMEWIGKDTTTIQRISKIAVSHVMQWAFDGMLEKMMPLIDKCLEANNWKWDELYDVLLKIRDTRLERIYSANFIAHYKLVKEEVRPKTFCQKLKDARQKVYDQDLRGGDVLAYEKTLMEPLAKEFIDGEYYRKEDEVAAIVFDDQFLDMWFSPSLRKIMTSEQLDEILSIFQNIVKQYDKDDFRSGFMFRFCYDFRDTDNVRRFFESIINDGYSGLYVRFLAHCETDDFASYKQLKDAIDKKLIQENSIDLYIDNVTLYTKEQILNLLKRVREEYPSHIVSLMSFVIRRQYNDEFYTESDVQPVVKQLVLDYPLTGQEKAHLDFEYGRFVAFMLERTHDDAFALAMGKKVIDAYNETWMHNKLDGIFTELFRDYLDIIWDVFMQAFVSEEKPGFYVQIRDEIGSGFGFGIGPMFQYGDERIMAMCKEYPNQAPVRVAEMIPVFTPAAFKTIGIQENVKAERFSDLFIWLLDNYADQEGVLEGLHANLGSYSWTGSVIPLINRKIKCFEQIKEHNNPVVREWVEKCLDELQREYSDERNREEYMRLHYS